MKKRKKFIIVVLSILIILTITLVFMMAMSTTPNRLRQMVVLKLVKDCIWHGYDGTHALNEAEGTVEKIKLPDSILEYPPISLMKLEEYESFNKKCNLFYNPKGYEEGTWILFFDSKDIDTLIEGNLVLWSDKSISRKHGMMEGIEEKKDVKYYYYHPPEILK